MKKKDFDSVFIHIHEFDAAVHLANLHSSLAFSKVKSTENNVKQIFEQLDDDTTLVISSDHGMADYGHGGFDGYSTEGIFFAYRKKGFLGTKKANSTGKSKYFRLSDVCNILHYYIGMTSPLPSFGQLPDNLYPYNEKQRPEEAYDDLLKIANQSIIQKEAMIKQYNIKAISENKELNDAIKKFKEMYKEGLKSFDIKTK